MKTRTLLLLALGCGLAILLAGGVLLVKLAGQDDPEPPVALGVESSIGDMRVTVLSAAEQPSANTLTVELVLGGVDDPDGAAGFELIASGRPIPPGDASTCGPRWWSRGRARSCSTCRQPTASRACCATAVATTRRAGTCGVERMPRDADDGQDRDARNADVGWGDTVNDDE